MIKPGIKIGPTDWKSKLALSQTKYCEIWYHANKPQQYSNLFAYLKKNHINTGIHFHGELNNGFAPNIAYPNPKILKPTLDLIKKNIDIAAKNSFHYVNIHSGNRRVYKVDFKKPGFSLVASIPKIDLRQAEQTQQKSLEILHQYAQSKNILLLTETIPSKDSPRWYDLKERLKPINLHPVPVKSLIKMSQKGFFITNDISHTFCDESDQPLDYLWQQLLKKTKQLAPFTKLLHINTVMPPFNGTDTHHGITKTNYKIKGIFPTHEKMIQLLKLFKNRNDVWAINEPRSNHIDNFFALKQLISKLS